MSSDPDRLRAPLTERLEAGRKASDSLFQMVSSEAITERPIPERHRVIFYFGHVEAFDWNLIGRTTMGFESFHQTFDDLFAFGIDPIDGNLPSDRPSDWPTLDEISAYNARVRSRIDRVLETTRFDERDDLRNGLVFDVAIEHRWMHVETLCYMLHWLSLDRKKSPHRRPADPDAPESRKNDKALIPTGIATLGKDRDDGFGWDNEFEEVQIEVPSFAIDRNNVTNGEFLEFVREGGYTEPSLWKPEDWEWKESEGIRWPRFWSLPNGGDPDRWRLRNMFDIRPLPQSWPVYVSQAEASAYAEWKGQSLPSEAQLHRAAYGTPEGPEREYPWGSAAPDGSRGNFDLHRWDPTPVGAFPGGDSAFGVSDLVGNGWEWTSTVFEPYAGFERFPFYPGYSADFFDGQHFVTKGGSSRTAVSMLRRSFRNWFQPRYPYIYATFRLVER